MMSITPFLTGISFDPETRRVIGVAFEMTRLALGVTDRDDFSNSLVAERLIELAKTGERSPDMLCERALQALRAGK